MTDIDSLREDQRRASGESKLYAGQRILDGLKDAVAGNFSRVTIEGQTWARIDPAPAGYRTIPIQQYEALMAAVNDLAEIAHAENGSRGAYCKFERGRTIARKTLAALRAAGIGLEDKS